MQAGQTLLRRLVGFRQFLVARDGAFALEFAFVAPVLILLFVATAEFSRLLGLRNELQWATEEAGRYAMASLHRSETDAQFQQRTRDSLISVPGSDVSVTVARATVNSVNYVTISASVNYAFLSYLGLPPVLITGSTRVPLVVIE